jgi:hypothetical protein
MGDAVEAIHSVVLEVQRNRTSLLSEPHHVRHA